MHTRLSFLLVLLLVCAVSAQQPKPSGGAPPPGAGGPPVSPGVGGAPAGLPAPSAAEAATIADVMAFEKACDDAAVRGDAAFLERAVSDDFVMTHGDGWITGGLPIKVDTKATWVEYVKRQPPPYVYRTLDSVQVELHGDIAITIGRYRYLPRSINPNPNPNPNPSHLYVWFERLYAKKNGQWQFLSHRTVNGPGREADEKK